MTDPASRPEAVVFDIGNVLLEWAPERFYDARIGPERRAALFEAVDLHAMNAAIDLGADFRATVYATARRHPEHAAEIRMWHDNWLEMAAPEIAHSARLLRRLRARGIPVYALSNFGAGSFEVARTAYPVLAEFDRALISGYRGQVKPDPAFYAALEAESGVAPDRLLFTDDRSENIAAAAARGWQVHRFTDPGALGRRLVAEGLLSAEEAAAPTAAP